MVERRYYFRFMDHELECAAHARGRDAWEATLVVRRFAGNALMQRTLTPHCGVRDSVEAAIGCARERGELWVLRNG